MESEGRLRRRRVRVDCTAELSVVRCDAFHDMAFLCLSDLGMSRETIDLDRDGHGVFFVSKLVLILVDFVDGSWWGWVAKNFVE